MHRQLVFDFQSADRVWLRKGWKTPLTTLLRFHGLTRVSCLLFLPYTHPSHSSSLTTPLFVPPVVVPPPLPLLPPVLVLPFVFTLNVSFNLVGPCILPFPPEAIGVPTLDTFAVEV